MSDFDSEQLKDSDEQTQDEKLVPVSEAIRYRKRAQAAEQQLGELSRNLESANTKLQQLQNQQSIVNSLAKSGVKDLETAALVAEKRLGQNNGKSVDEVITEMKTQKPYLFGTDARQFSAPPKSAGAKDKAAPGQSTLARAAKRAASSGARADISEYLKLRRNLK